MSDSDESETPVDPAVLGDLSGSPRGDRTRRWLTDRRQILKDVHVKMYAMLGSTKIAIGKLSDAKDGDVIPLDQDAGAPVELFAEGHLIGRGELVVVGEKYGVRIIEIASVDGP